MIGFSIVVCCYNSELRLPETLRYLASLDRTGIILEILIINNASKDSTSEVAKLEWSKYDVPDVSFKVVDEPIPGLTAARIKGINESTHDYLLFCDDDNWLDEKYIKSSFELFEKYPNAAVIGGLGSPVFESKPKPDWFEEYQGIYAVGKQADHEMIVNAQRGFVFGAASVWRKEILKEIIRSPLILSDRIGSKLSSSGDVELCLNSIIKGYDVVYSPVLRFFHFIPISRVTMQYIQRFMEDSIPQAYYLHGLKYKAGVTPEMFNSKIKRTWWGQMIILLKNQFSSKAYPVPILWAQISVLLKLNIKYDRSFT